MDLSKQNMNGSESIRNLERYFSRKAGDRRFVSKDTITSYTKTVWNFVKYSGFEDPDAMLSKVDDASMLGALDDYIGWCNEKGNSPGTQITRFNQLKRWLRVNDVELDWKKVILPKLRRVVQDKAPSRSELRQILAYAPTWLNTAILMLATSGLRSGTLEGLKMKHLNMDAYPDLAMIEVPPELSKSRVGYFTFISPETKGALEKHLDRRRKKGETLTPESPIINPPIADQTRYSALARAYARTLVRAGLNEKSRGYHVLHLHTLRKWFRTQLEGAMTSSYIERLLGHVSGEYLDGAYFRPPDSDMVEAYRRAIPNLTIFEDVLSEEFQRKMLKRQAKLTLSPEEYRRFEEILARSKNADEAMDKFQKLKMKEIPKVPRDEEFKKMEEKLSMMKKELEEKLVRLEEKTERPENNFQYKKVESEEEMLRLLNLGWELYREVNHGGFVMRKG